MFEAIVALAMIALIAFGSLLTVTKVGKPGGNTAGVAVGTLILNVLLILGIIYLWMV